MWGVNNSITDARQIDLIPEFLLAIVGCVQLVLRSRRGSNLCQEFGPDSNRVSYSDRIKLHAARGAVHKLQSLMNRYPT
jgi:hypothetical protein